MKFQKYKIVKYHLVMIKTLSIYIVENCFRGEKLGKLIFLPQIHYNNIIPEDK